VHLEYWTGGEFDSFLQCVQVPPIAYLQFSALGKTSDGIGLQHVLHANHVPYDVEFIHTAIMSDVPLHQIKNCKNTSFGRNVMRHDARDRLALHAAISVRLRWKDKI